jgi:hypothetical protein
MVFPPSANSGLISSQTKHGDDRNILMIGKMYFGDWYLVFQELHHVPKMVMKFKKPMVITL